MLHCPTVAFLSPKITADTDKSPKCSASVTIVQPYLNISVYLYTIHWDNTLSSYSVNKHLCTSFPSTPLYIKKLINCRPLLLLGGNQHRCNPDHSLNATHAWVQDYFSSILHCRLKSFKTDKHEQFSLLFFSRQKKNCEYVLNNLSI